jgi:hypothetical protein
VTKAAILLAPLNKVGLSHTETLVEFLTGVHGTCGIQSDVIKLMHYETRRSTLIEGNMRTP